MKWFLEFNGDRLLTTFDSKASAMAYKGRMGSALASLYEAVPDTTDRFHKRILTEGLLKGDLRRIVLPQISIDEYVPADAETDNIVIAFYLKGVPEAIIPFRDFVMKCGGVIDTSYGESETIPEASVVYVEFERKSFKFDYLQNIMKQISLLTELSPDDFTMMFPTSSKKIPYSRDAVEAYFNKRTAEDNWKAQQAVIGDENAVDDTEIPENPSR